MNGTLNTASQLGLLYQPLFVGGYGARLEL
jgi:hypothetical protein